MELTDTLLDLTSRESILLERLLLAQNDRIGPEYVVGCAGTLYGVALAVSVAIRRAEKSDNDEDIKIAKNMMADAECIYDAFASGKLHIGQIELDIFESNYRRNPS